jgi:hypothetical protein
MHRMCGISLYESTEGLGRAKQDARAESTWMCGAIVSDLHWVKKSPRGRGSYGDYKLPTNTFVIPAKAEIHLPSIFQNGPRVEPGVTGVNGARVTSGSEPIRPGRRYSKPSRDQRHQFLTACRYHYPHSSSHPCLPSRHQPVKNRLHKGFHTVQAGSTNASGS